MPTRWWQVLLVSVVLAPRVARAEPPPTIAVAPVTGERATADLRARVANSLTDGLKSAGATVAPLGAGAFVLRGTLEVEGRSYALRLEMLDAKTGAVLATREDRCEICTETEALETWNTAASTLKARVIKRPDGAQASPASAPGMPPTSAVVPLLPAPAPTADAPASTVRIDASAEPRPRHRALGWTAVAAGAIGIGAGVTGLYLDGNGIDCTVPGAACPMEYHGNLPWAVASVAAGVALVSAGVLFLLGKL
jgi:hypothetical protein